MARLRVQAFGQLTVQRADIGVVSIPASCVIVVGFLLTNRQRRVTRRELAETLWADTDGSHALGALSTALWRLRQALPPDCKVVEGAGDSIGFAMHDVDWVDCIAMESRVRSVVRGKIDSHSHEDLQRLARGVRLYQGEYLHGLDHDWACVERERLRNLYCDALYHLLMAHASSHDWAAAVEWGRRLSAAEPLREDVHRVLMQAYANTGDRAKAITQYQACERLLRDELGIEPMPETLALYTDLVPASKRVRPNRPTPRLEAHGQLRHRLMQVRRVLKASQQRLDQVLKELERLGRS